jgi:hypothetical protein
VIVNDDALGRFAKSVELLESDPSTGNVYEAVEAGRVAWAAVYGTLLLAGGFRRDELEDFSRKLTLCAQIVKSHKGGQHTAAYLQQITRYRLLVDLYCRDGLPALNRAIEEAFESRAKVALPS